VSDPIRMFAARLHDGRGLVACLEPVRLVFASLFETGGATLGCGRPRTFFVAPRAAVRGPRIGRRTELGTESAWAR
jgi:hypothetical protein